MARTLTRPARSRRHAGSRGQPATDAISQAAVRAMADPRLYPDRPAVVELRETHVSRVFLAGTRAYKTKKPVLLPFLDCRRLERRRELCEEEIRLNRRLAPDIYLGIRALVPAAGEPGFALADPGQPGAVEYAVEMVRYDEERTLERTLRRGELRAEDLRRLGALLAAFHAACPVADPQAALAAMRRAIGETFESLWAQPLVDPAALWACERFMGAFLAGRRPELLARGRRGLVREGHGDLRAEHVLLGASLAVVDCLEFDPALRRTDVAADLAFLVMDLHRLGAAACAGELVAAYRQAGGEPGDDALVAFFAAYRALVRAKVALLRAEQVAAGEPRDPLVAEARGLIELARRLCWQGRLPALLLIAGVPASGKSQVAAALAAAAGVEVIGSDVTRKRMAGLAPKARAAPALYAPARSRATYAELGRLAAAALSCRPTVIVDGTFRRRADRAAFLDALGGACEPVLLECVAPAAVLLERARRREREPGRVSDADAAVVARERGSWEPAEEFPPARHIALRTDRPLAQTLDALAGALDERVAIPEPARR